MWKAALLGAAAAIALGTSAAKADVFVYGTVLKTVDITIYELIDITKDVDIDVNVTTEATSVAESEAVFNQRNQYNHACENCAEKTDLIVSSVLSNSGITSVNQSSGNQNNQGTVISIAFYDASNTFTGATTGVGVAPSTLALTPPPEVDPDDPTLADSQVVGEQVMYGNTIHSVNIIFRDSVIRGSVNDNVGITAVNQATGNQNNQSNAVSVAVTPNLGVALSDVALGQLNSSNTTTEANVTKSATIANSVNNNTGITQVNQTAGVHANQANVVSVSAAGLN